MVIEEKKNFFGLFLIIIIVVMVCFSGCIDLTCANVSNLAIGNGWNENVALRNTGVQFLGLEKWCSTTYEINGKYPASLTVTTLKSIVLSDENEILQNTRRTIEDTFQNNIELLENSSGERILKNNHKSLYTLYDGDDVNKDEKVKIICEIWNCADSGTSVICIGIAYITNQEIPDVFNYYNWKKIVKDSSGSINGYIDDNGLIDSINCH